MNVKYNKVKFLPLSIVASSLMFLMSVNGAAVQMDANPQSPRFVIENNFGSVSSNRNSGEYLLIQFWNATDAQSRIKASQFDKLVNEHTFDNLQYAAVYTGEDRDLFKMVVSADDLDMRSQYMLSDSFEAGNISTEFSLSTGNHTFLINPQGRIVAINPTINDIESLIVKA